MPASSRAVLSAGASPADGMREGGNVAGAGCRTGQVGEIRGRPELQPAREVAGRQVATRLEEHRQQRGEDRAAAVQGIAVVDDVEVEGRTRDPEHGESRLASEPRAVVGIETCTAPVPPALSTTKANADGSMVTVVVPSLGLEADVDLDRIERRLHRARKDLVWIGARGPATACRDDGREGQDQGQDWGKAIAHGRNLR